MDIPSLERTAYLTATAITGSGGRGNLRACGSDQGPVRSWRWTPSQKDM